MSQCPYGYFDYYAQNGDTFASLSKKFAVGEQEIRNLNKDIDISEGTQVRIPWEYGGCARGAFHVIKRGETLFKIARRSGIPMSSLLAANPYLNPAYYIPGQVIVIPCSLSGQTDGYYVLGSGEGLFDVLRRFNMDITTFCLLNPDIRPMDVQPGQRVRIKKKKEKPGRWYTIAPGENLVKVAARHGIAVSTLLGANENIHPSEFVPGVRVRIPD